MNWKESEIKYLRETYPSNHSLKDISIYLHRSVKSIKHKAARLGLSRQRIPFNKPKDPQHRKIIEKRYYEANRTKIYQRKIARLRKYKSELVKELGGKCSKCGYNRCLAALDFHHTMGNKESEVTFLLKNYSKEKALKEARKCILICANCHRELHYRGPYDKG